MRVSGAGLDPWRVLFDAATHARAPDESELVPCWVAHGDHKVERVLRLLPLSREVEQLERLKRSLAVYRVAFGQPRQAELVALIDNGRVSLDEVDSWVIRLDPPSRDESVLSAGHAEPATDGAVPSGPRQARGIEAAAIVPLDSTSGE